MKKDEENKLIDVMIDIAQEMKGMRKDMNFRLERLEKLQVVTNSRLEKLEKQQAHTNVELSGMRLTFMKYADSTKKITDHEKRINKIERIVLK